jgi:asparagine synthase (glutamine-hydrolysing)
MCGIAGIVDISKRTRADSLRDIAERMAYALRHRGPDSSGTWHDVTCGVALAHSRLAIIDVSPAGHQPMTCSTGRFVMSFNGEIYNHVSIRTELANGMQAPSWRGHSDTETVLAAISAWGVEKTLSKLRGMFAIAVWDREQRSLILARDRMGEKPLYYGWLGNILVFGSELKALTAHPFWKGDVDRDVLSLYMRHGHVPAPYCIYAGIKKLLPGTFLRFDADRGRSRVGTYWSLFDAVTEGARDPFQGSPQEATDTLEAIMKDAVAEQMVADVPIGAFLSGGIDSSMIVALMQAQNHQPVCTFTVGFREREYDEADYARAVAKHLGTKHVAADLRRTLW